jgi:RNA polymerase sporulation-specific sigma factor
LQILEQKLCREPTVSEIANHLGVSAEDVAEAICASQNTVSLTYEGEDGVKENDLPTVSTEDEISDRLDIEEAFSRLEEKEKELMICRYYRYMTQSNTAKFLNMTQVQVSRAEKKILLKLRDYLG